MKLVLLLAALLALPAHAQTPPGTKPLIDISRVAVAGGVGYDWHNGDALNPVPVFKKEFVAGVHAAYVLTEHWSAAAAAVYGVDNKQLRLSPGMHYRFRAGEQFFALGLSYDYYAGKPPAVPFFAHEWAASFIYARPLTKSLLLGLSETYGMDNREWRTSLGIRFPLWIGGNS